MYESDWKQIAEHYFHVAAWFAQNPPGTLVPEWCFLAWPIDRNLLITELIPERIRELGV